MSLSQETLQVFFFKKGFVYLRHQLVILEEPLLVGK